MTPLLFVGGGLLAALYLDRKRPVNVAGGEGVVAGEKPAHSTGDTASINAAGQPITTILTDAGHVLPKPETATDLPVSKPMVCTKFGCGTTAANKPGGGGGYQSPPIIAIPNQAGGTVQAARIAIVSTKGMSTAQASQRIQEYAVSSRMMAI